MNRARKMRNISGNVELFNASIREVDNGYIIESYNHNGQSTYVIQKEGENDSSFQQVLNILGEIQKVKSESNQQENNLN